MITKLIVTQGSSYWVLDVGVHVTRRARTIWVERRVMTSLRAADRAIRRRCVYSRRGASVRSGKYFVLDPEIRDAIIGAVQAGPEGLGLAEELVKLWSQSALKPNAWLKRWWAAPTKNLACLIV